MSAPSAIKNAKVALIGGTPSTGQTLTRLDSATFRANTGEVGVFSPDGERLVGTGGTVVAGVSRVGIEGEPFVLAVSRGASKAPLVSDVIENVSLAKSVAGAAATEESKQIGYNGTSGDLSDAVANYLGELFSVQLIFQQFFSGTDAETIKSGYYQSLLTDDEIDIANGIVKSLNANFSRDVKNSSGDPFIVAEVLSAAASVVTLGTITVTKGSKLAALSNTTDVAANGDYIRFGNTTSDDCYRVESGAGTATVTLDRPYTGADAVFAIGAADSLTAAAVAAASAGISILGQPLDFDPEKKRYTKVRFDLTPNDAFGTAPVTVTSAASAGNGTYEAVANEERFLIGFKAEQYRVGEPNLFNISDLILADSAVAGGFYDSLNIRFRNNLVDHQNDVSLKELNVYVPATTPTHITTANDGVSDALETLIPASVIQGADLSL